MPLDDSACLNEEQRFAFMEVIADSLRVSHRSQLFSWLQGGFQYLLGHEVMICGIKTSDSETYAYEYFASSLYFNNLHFNEQIKPDTGIVDQVLNLWKKTSFPIFVNNQQTPAEYNNYAVININETALKESEMLSLIAHGFGDYHSKISTFVIFVRLSKQPSAIHAHILELIMPHLHCALLRVASNKNSVALNSNKTAKKITGRESEVLQWMHMGKTNWEISSILNVSPLTVKNHVQNILRKLDVQNRGQAAVKASKLGLVKILR